MMSAPIIRSFVLMPRAHQELVRAEMLNSTSTNDTTHDTRHTTHDTRHTTHDNMWVRRDVAMLEEVRVKVRCQIRSLPR
jgi:hypothetical protein